MSPNATVRLAITSSFRKKKDELNQARKPPCIAADTRYLALHNTEHSITDEHAEDQVYATRVTGLKRPK